MNFDVNINLLDKALYLSSDEIIVETWVNALEDLTFVDDTPFGIKEHIENNKTEQK